MNIKSTIKRILNGLIRRGYWYNNILFEDCNKFWAYNVFNTEVINLGSTSAVNAFCYDGLGIKAANFALGHHPLSGDLAILKNYCSYLKPNGSTVILSLCPFSSLSGNYQYFEDRYYTLLYPTTLPFYSFRREQLVKAMIAEPLRSYTIMGFLQDIKRLVVKPNSKMLTEEQMLIDAERWIKSWMREFSLRDFDTPLTLLNQDAVEEAAFILNSLVDFCKSRNIRPVILIPPVYRTLGKLFSEKARKLIIESLLNRVKDKSVSFINYMDDIEFANDITLFQNSYLMNKKGAQLFTKRVLSDLQLIRKM